MDCSGAEVLAYRQMGKHSHLVPHTLQAKLLHLMRSVNGVYTQALKFRVTFAHGRHYESRIRAREVSNSGRPSPGSSRCYHCASFVRSIRSWKSRSAKWATRKAC